MRKIFYYLELENESPLHIGNGESFYTNSDLIKDSKNNFFIPGTSIAGPMMHYLGEKNIFQPTFKVDDEEQSKLSPLYVSDALLIDESIQYEIRDGVQLENKLSVDLSKFDYEIIPSGQRFKMYCEITKYDDQPYEEVFEDVLKHINQHDIRFGYKTTRGLGCLKIVYIAKHYINKFNDYKRFDRFNKETYREKNISLNAIDNNQESIVVTLKQNGGLIIRTSNIQENNIDYRYLSNQSAKAVIPGSTWAGFFKDQIASYKHIFNLDVDDIFGIVDNKKNIKKKSKIIFEESTIDHGYTRYENRIRINAFFGSVNQRAMLNQISYYNGTTSLKIKIPNTIDKRDELIQLIVLILKEMDEGMVAVGGETAIGKGMFKVEKIVIDGQVREFSDYLEVKMNDEYKDC